MSALPTHALSLYAPWCWAILHAGKNIENRDWKPSYPGADFRGDFWIHASLFGGERGKARVLLEDECRAALDTAGLAGVSPLPSLDDLFAWCVIRRGKILGRATVDDAVARSESPWFFGPCGLCLSGARRSLAPVPCKGALGFWQVPPAVLAELRKVA